MKHKCAECPLKAKTLIPYVSLVDGVLLYVCRQCAEKLGYQIFMKEL
jgi:protein-arginine kinase activator protein McsA